MDHVFHLWVAYFFPLGATKFGTMAHSKMALSQIGLIARLTINGYVMWCSVPDMCLSEHSYAEYRYAESHS
jgi:hypothetical protein